MSSIAASSGGHDVRTMRPTVNLNWIYNPSPPRLTPYQHYIRSFDWAKTALGPIQSWSRELRQTVLFMMAELSPVILYWGERHTIIYNEAYIPLIGKKHPQLQGMEASAAFPEFWDRFERVLFEQSISGETHTGDASMILIERHGFLEETYFNWKLIPVIGDDGVVIGSYGRPTESSNEVLNSRRVACIKSLAQKISDITSFEALWQKSLEGLSTNEKDIPLAMLYSIEQPKTQPTDASLLVESATYKLEAYLGVPADHPCTKAQASLQYDQDGMAQLLRTTYEMQSIHQVRLVDTKVEHLFQDLEKRGFGFIEELVLLPLKANEQIVAILVLGVNPHLEFVGKYKEFVLTIGHVLSPQISKLMLANEVKSHDEIAQSAVSEFQRSEMKFARFAQRSPLGLTLTDTNGKIMYANEAWYNFCGLKSGEHEFLGWVDTVHEDDLPIVQEWWHRVTRLKQSGTFQVRSKQPWINGDMKLPNRTGIVAVYPDLDEEGNVATIMGLVTDISELKWVEEQLRLRQREIEASERKFRQFAEHAPVGVVTTDESGYVQFANNTWRSFYNFDSDYLFTEPEPWLNSLNHEDAPLAKKYFQEVRNQKTTKAVEVRLRRPKGLSENNRATQTEFWLLSTGFAEHNPDGTVSAFVFWVTDISDQKAAEKVLTDRMEEAIRLKNTQERFVDMISHEIRNPLSAILHCGEEVVDAMKSCLTSMESTSINQTSPSNGDTSSQALIKHYVSNALDAANTIMYCVQHQKQIVDDVLTLSKLDADLLVVSPIPVQPIELVRSALKIFEPELKSSKIELSYEINPSLEELDVDWIMLDPNRFLQIVINLVTNAIKFTRNSQTKQILISVGASENRPSQQHEGVQYVPPRVLDNGVDQASPGDFYLCFSVADTGKGLSESERTILFKRFAQASPKTHIEYGGSGLGLFISRQITEMLGGGIGVGSEPGKGAVFAFYVRTRRAKPPRRASLGVESVSLYTKTLVTPTPGTWVTAHTDNKESPRKMFHRKSTTQTPQSITSRRRVLVVEDNLVNQKVLCKQLRNRGFLVEAANHGREALDALEKIDPNDTAVRFDVILCDIEMPVMDGIQCVTEIRRLEHEGRFRGHIPIIGVTANVRSKQVTAAIDVGMDGVTTKPYRIDELIAHIDRVSAEVKTSHQPVGSIPEELEQP